MSASNVPDDWGCYYRKCDACGGIYHLSECGCGCMDGLRLCDGCEEAFPEDDACDECGQCSVCCECEAEP